MPTTAISGLNAITYRSALRAFARVVTCIFDWCARRETVRLLNAVDGATLRDLGISDIESTVYGDPADRMRGYDPGWRKR